MRGDRNIGEQPAPISGDSLAGRTAEAEGLTLEPPVECRSWLARLTELTDAIDRRGVCRLAELPPDLLAAIEAP